MSRVGDCWDDAVAETSSTLERELITQSDGRTRGGAAYPTPHSLAELERPFKQERAAAAAGGEILKDELHIKYILPKDFNTMRSVAITIGASAIKNGSSLVRDHALTQLAENRVPKWYEVVDGYKPDVRIVIAGLGTTKRASSYLIVHGDQIRERRDRGQRESQCTLGD